MEVNNLAGKENLSKRCNHSLLPLGIRGLITGKSRCGRNTLLTNFLLRLGMLDYDNINIFGKSLFQPECHFLKKAFEEKLPKAVIIRLFENQNEITYWVFLLYQLLKKWRKRLETYLMLSAIFINR